MQSIKVHDATAALLNGLRGRLGSTRDEVIQELVRRYNAALSDALTAGDRLKRVEEMLVRLTLRTQEDEQAAPPTFKVE